MPPFLTAEWRHLLMLSHAVEPSVVRPFVPAGAELDDWNGTHLVSLVGFLFLRTRLHGVPVPGHTDFEEVNLRFYIRRKVDGAWRRAVAFVREIVPRRAIAWTAQAVYGERYVACPMRHELVLDERTGHLRRVTYAWTLGGREHRIGGTLDGEPVLAPPGSLDAFIVEHEWGEVQRRRGTVAYRVEHAPWPVRPVVDPLIDLDAARAYGPAFAEALRAPPVSAFLADGSPVVVRHGRREAATGATA